MLFIQTDSIGMAEIALDDSRLYYAAKNDDNIDAITTYNTSQLRDEWYNLSTAFTNLLSIEATSPGTQPLPYGILPHNNIFLNNNLQTSIVCLLTLHNKKIVQELM